MHIRARSGRIECTALGAMIYALESDIPPPRPPAKCLQGRMMGRVGNEGVASRTRREVLQVTKSFDQDSIRTGCWLTQLRT